MKQLRSLNKYFKKYSSYFVGGILFTAIANLFAVISPVIIRGVIDSVQALLVEYRQLAHLSLAADMRAYIFDSVLWSGLLLLAFALLRGVFMFLMRQTIIVMSRKIEYDQKNEIYAHYQRLDTHFFKTHTTGDLMNRISEDVGRVRMYTGPAIMYFTNMAVITLMSIWGMLRINATLAGWVIAPLPLLAITIYTVNRRIYKKSADIQTQLSALTTTAQETFSGIRVIKSFAQEAYMISFFNRQSAHYKESAVQLSMTEAFYFPAMNLFIGLSLLSTIGIGGMAAIKGIITTGNIAEFVIYINLLIFPISSIGLVASMTQRAAASQKRIDDFLQTKPAIANVSNAITTPVEGAIVFNNVSFTYPHTGIKALSNFSLTINKGEKVAILGATGSGKSTLAHLLLRMYDPESGLLSFNGIASSQYDLQHLREAIAYTPQDAYLFSDTIYNNVKFGKENA
ncbi:MAG: ABC transporter ATP-binding protein, partial [Chitinophagia bacterium]|nr:ABC transporter ATP-binding protein [Chitinophagia bacterium]